VLLCALALNMLRCCHFNMHMQQHLDMQCTIRQLTDVYLLSLYAHKHSMQTPSCHCHLRLQNSMYAFLQAVGKSCEQTPASHLCQKVTTQ
jgi:hypothetical protein